MERVTHAFCLIVWRRIARTYMPSFLYSKLAKKKKISRWTWSPDMACYSVRHVGETSERKVSAHSGDTGRGDTSFNCMT